MAISSTTNPFVFYSKNVYFTVSLDGEVIYDFHPDAPKLFGKAYGVFPHAISLPVLNKDGNLYIEIDNIYPGSPGYIRDILLDNSDHFILSKLQESTYEFIFCLIVFVFGIVLVIIGIVGRYFGDKRFEIISMGIFGMVSALWIASETQMLPILTGLFNRMGFKRDIEEIKRMTVGTDPNCHSSLFLSFRKCDPYRQSSILIFGSYLSAHLFNEGSSD